MTAIRIAIDLLSWILKSVFKFIFSVIAFVMVVVLIMVATHPTEAKKVWDGYRNGDYSNIGESITDHDKKPIDVQSLIEASKKKAYDSDDGYSKVDITKMCDAHGVTSYASYQKSVVGMDDKYNGMSDEELGKLVPMDEEWKDYRDTWSKWLSLTRDELTSKCDPELTSNPNEAEKKYAQYERTLTVLEQEFLHNDSLGVSVSSYDSDGNITHKYTGKSPKKYPDEAMENNIRVYDAVKGPDGTYIKAGEELAKIAGMTVDYDFSRISDYCTPKGNDDTSATGMFCSGNPYVLYVNQKFFDPKKVNEVNTPYNPYYISTIKHEIAHRQIFLICGTTQPNIGASIEGVTNSYAVKFLGADPSEPAKSVSDEYHTNAQTDAAAERIHSGDCGATQQ